MAKWNTNLSLGLRLKAEYLLIEEIIEVCDFTTKISRFVGTTSLAIGTVALYLTHLSFSPLINCSAFFCVTTGITLRMGADIGDESIGKNNVNEKLREYYRNLQDCEIENEPEPEHDEFIDGLNNSRKRISMDNIQSDLEKIHNELAGTQSHDNWKLIYELFIERHLIIILFVTLSRVIFSLISSYNGVNLTEHNTSDVHTPELSLTLALAMGVFAGIGIIIFMVDLSSSILRHENKKALMKKQKNVLKEFDDLLCFKESIYPS